MGLLVATHSAAGQTAATPRAAHAATPVPLADTLNGPARTEYEAGRILFGDADYAGALFKFQRAFEHTPDLRLLWNMAACEKNLRRYGNALELLERYRREGDLQMTVSHRDEVMAVLTTLRTLVSTVHVTVSEADAEVFVDDRPAGITPLPRPLFVDLGARRIRVSKAGFQDTVVTQEFSGGSELTLLLTMTPAPMDAQLSIVADDASTIRIDGRVVAQTRWQGALLAGEHTLRVTAPGMTPYVKEIVVQAGEPRTLYVHLEPDESGGVPAWVWMGAGVLAASGLATGAYFLLRTPSTPENTQGTWRPGVVQLPLRLGAR